jgi:hypothetical protein
MNQSLRDKVRLRAYMRAIALHECCYPILEFGSGPRVLFMRLEEGLEAWLKSFIVCTSTPYQMNSNGRNG